jgi:hypothetical protein
MMLVKAKRALGLKIPILSAIPDYGIPSAVFNPRERGVRPDALVVMSEETQAHYLTTEGLTPDQVHLSGFITRPAFAQLGARLRECRDRRAERRRLWLSLEREHPSLRFMDPAQPTLLFMGGSAWTAKTRPILEALLALPEVSARLNVLVVCGRDTKFQEELTTVAAPLKNFAAFGFVPPQMLAELMAVSDFPILGSLAPASMQELLELSCGPLLLFRYIPGTEEPHTTYIREQQIGRYEPDAPKMLDLIMQLTGFSPLRPDTHELLRNFPAQAQRIRSQSRARAHQLPGYLARIIGEPPLTDVSFSVRTTSQDGLPAATA